MRALRARRSTARRTSFCARLGNDVAYAWRYLMTGLHLVHKPTSSGTARRCGPRSAAVDADMRRTGNAQCLVLVWRPVPRVHRHYLPLLEPGAEDSLRFRVQHLRRMTTARVPRTNR